MDCDPPVEKRWCKPFQCCTISKIEFIPKVKNATKLIVHRLKVQQGVDGLGLGVVVLLVHVAPVLGPPLGDDDGQGCQGEATECPNGNPTIQMKDGDVW